MRPTICKPGERLAVLDVAADEQLHAEGQRHRPERREHDHAWQRHRIEERLVHRMVQGPLPPPQLRPDVIEDLVERVVDEPDTDRADQHTAPAEHPEDADDLVGHRGHHRVDRHDVERQPAPEEVDGEHVVREHRVDVVGDPERAGKYSGGSMISR